MTQNALFGTICLMFMMIGLVYLVFSEKGSRLDHIGRGFTGIGAVGVAMFYLLDQPGALEAFREQVALKVIVGVLGALTIGLFIKLARRG